MNYQLNLSLFSNSIIYNIYIIIYILYIKRKTRSFYSEIYGIQREKKNNLQDHALFHGCSNSLDLGILKRSSWVEGLVIVVILSLVLCVPLSLFAVDFGLLFTTFLFLFFHIVIFIIIIREPPFRCIRKPNLSSF